MRVAECTVFVSLMRLEEVAWGTGPGLATELRFYPQIPFKAEGMGCKSDPQSSEV